MELRLFPLHAVLFPGMALPLNVFEPRYLQLVDECLRDDEPFGVALIREGPEVGGPAVPFAVGTTARIERAEPGMLNAISLLARGEQRFRIAELHHDRPYLWADAELIEEPEGEAPEELREQARAQLGEFAELSLGVPFGSGALADAIGATGAGSPEARQQLLETLDPARRLSGAVNMLGPDLDQLRERLAEVAMRRWSGPGALN
jgi:ATP-dependent Lon protease